MGERENRAHPGRRQTHRRHRGVRGAARRWVVERTFAWLMHSRRLARDYETLTANSEAGILLSMITRMGRRLAQPPASGRC
ncbi:MULTISPECIES: transposase [unclassified Streptomyces]|uniref:transposase n=1 Tax=unclassified Streptomyces TaxID=2593676 RepID=UPI00386C3280